MMKIDSLSVDGNVKMIVVVKGGNSDGEKGLALH